MPGAHARWARQTSVATLLLTGRVGTPGASLGSCSLCRPRPMGPGTGTESVMGSALRVLVTFRQDLGRQLRKKARDQGTR